MYFCYLLCADMLGLVVNLRVFSFPSLPNIKGVFRYERA